MTAYKLIRAAAATNRRWRVSGGGAGTIRTDDPMCDCPIQAVAMAAGCRRSASLGEMAAYCGLSEKDGHALIHASNRAKGDTLGDVRPVAATPLRNAMLRQLSPRVMAAVS